MKTFLFFLYSVLISFSGQAQIGFSNASFLLNNGNISSGVAMGVVDMNGDGLDDIVRLNNARNLVIGFQKADGTQFENYPTNFSNSTQWSLCAADVDKNGYNDLYIGGSYNRLRIVFFDSTGIDTIVTLGGPNIFAQCANFADINNDGDIDLFVCHDDGISAVFENEGAGVLQYNLDLITASSTIPSDNSGNYGTVWTDYDSDGDLDMYLSKCRLGVDDVNDGRRINMLFENDGFNHYSDVAEAKNIRPLGQSWATDFADIDNDGDLDAFIIYHDIVSKLFENDNNNGFIDITESSGIKPQLMMYYTGIQPVFEDFDNDGYIDLIASSEAGHYVFRNNGNKTFSAVNAFPESVPNIQSLAIGDLNNDGFLDVLTGFASGYNSPSSTKDKMYFNNGNDNNWFKIILKGKNSNINGIGARVEMYANGMKQVREVRSGEGYGIMNSLTTHFGIGTAMEIDSVIVRWPSGAIDIICSPEINTTELLTEGCNANCEGIISNLSETICAGDTFQFNGMDLTEGGSYSAQLISSGGCDSTVQLELTIVVVDISTNISTDIVVITANAENATFQWYDCDTDLNIEGETNASFEPIVSGDYAVIVTQEGCSDTSECYTVIISSDLQNVFDFDIELFPNPVKDVFYLSWTQNKARISVEVFDIAGALQFAQNAQNESSIEIVTKDLPSGIYLVNLTIDDKTGTLRLVKH